MLLITITRFLSENVQLMQSCHHIGGFKRRLKIHTILVSINFC